MFMSPPGSKSCVIDEFEDGVVSVTGARGPNASGAAACPGSGLSTGTSGGRAPAEHVASAACWALYEQLLARSYANGTYRPVHQIVVDAYAAQHAGRKGRPEVQTVALSLMTLGLFVENDVDPTRGPSLHKQMVARPPNFTWLDPPDQRHLMTVSDVLAARDPVEHRDFVHEWGRQVWLGWTPHHATIRAWSAYALAGAQ